VFYPLSKRCYDEGDAGSVVYQAHGGRVVGMLLGYGQKPHCGKTILTYITPIKDVFNDIKAFSAGFITDIRIAEEIYEEVAEDTAEGIAENTAEGTAEDSGEADETDE